MFCSFSILDSDTRACSVRAVARDIGSLSLIELAVQRMRQYQGMPGSSADLLTRKAEDGCHGSLGVRFRSLLGTCRQLAWHLTGAEGMQVLDKAKLLFEEYVLGLAGAAKVNMYHMEGGVC